LESALTYYRDSYEGIEIRYNSFLSNLTKIQEDLDQVNLELSDIRSERDRLQVELEEITSELDLARELTEQKGIPGFPYLAIGLGLAFALLLRDRFHI